jgi:chromosome segregation ATPase
MAKADNEPEVVRAARALEDEIASLEALSRAARKIRLTTQKSIARAAVELQATLALPDRLSARLKAVGEAMAHLEERQKTALAPLAELAAELRRRAQRLDEHTETFAALGKAAAEVNAELAAAGGDRAAAARAEARLREIAEGARALFEAARADDYPEIAREADVLKQRMAALGERLGRR